MTIPPYLEHGEDFHAPSMGKPVQVYPKFSDNQRWISDILQRRAACLPDALRGRIADFSGGVVRDALQLGQLTLRNAIDAERAVQMEDLDGAIRAMVDQHRSALSDYDGIERFLRHVEQTGQLYPDPRLRDILLSQGMLLREEGRYRVHPITRLLIEAAPRQGQ